MSERRLERANGDVRDISEEEAVLICAFLDRQNDDSRTLFFESTAHNWDAASETLSIDVTFYSEHVAVQSLADAVYTARFVHRGSDAA